MFSATAQLPPPARVSALDPSRPGAVLVELHIDDEISDLIEAPSIARRISGSIRTSFTAAAAVSSSTGHTKHSRFSPRLAPWRLNDW
jgi:hypothetical protein